MAENLQTGVFVSAEKSVDIEFICPNCKHTTTDSVYYDKLPQSVCVMCDLCGERCRIIPE